MSISEKLITITENVPKVYEKGKKDEHDKFWDANQDFGSRTSYTSAYVGSNGWNKDNFYPKYDIKPEGSAAQLFYAWEVNEKHKMDLAQRLEDCGVILDTSKATNLQSAFNYTRFTRIPTVDITGTTAANAGLFGNSWGSLITIDKIIMNENNQIANTWFSSASGLENLIIEGTIGQNGFNVKDCKKLSVASLLSILTALSKDQSIASGKSVTFSTVHQSVIEGDANCLEQLNLAVAAGWTIAYA